MLLSYSSTSWFWRCRHRLFLFFPAQKEEGCVQFRPVSACGVFKAQRSMFVFIAIRRHVVGQPPPTPCAYSRTNRTLPWPLSRIPDPTRSPTDPIRYRKRCRFRPTFLETRPSTTSPEHRRTATPGVARRSRQRGSRTRRTGRGPLRRARSRPGRGRAASIFGFGFDACGVCMFHSYASSSEIKIKVGGASACCSQAGGGD